MNYLSEIFVIEIFVAIIVPYNYIINIYENKEFKLLTDLQQFVSII